LNILLAKYSMYDVRLRHLWN